MDTRVSLLRVQPFSDDLLAQQLPPPVTRRVAVKDSTPAAPRSEIHGDPVRLPHATAVSLTPAEPGEAVVQSRAEVLPAPPRGRTVEAGRHWNVRPSAAVRARLRKEAARTWGTRVGGFVGLVLSVDFLLSHL
jgi:hypothetical protein